ncbi:RNA polymerase sigma factor [Pseudonocardia sp.]|uniref:RNA polymerase sigma factor n=1 Tax=Pseudonocardia sp. TaxID=60912 RepID=UPI003D0FE108
MTSAEATPPTPPTTTELLQRAGQGDRDAWEHLVRRYEPAVAASIRSCRLQEADARDAAQQTWLLMLEYGHRIREPEAMQGWLRTTARRECLRILRDDRRIDQLPDGDGRWCVDGTCDVEQGVVDADTARRLRALVASLPVRSAQLVRALFGDDAGSYAELSRSTGIPVGSIGPTRARALLRLRRLLEYEAEDHPGSARERYRTALA